MAPEYIVSKFYFAKKILEAIGQDRTHDHADA
jgi:hypothetical protein